MPSAAGCQPAVFYRSQTTKVCKATAIFPFVFPSEAPKLSESAQMGADLSAGAIQTPSIPALCSHTCCNWNCILIHRRQISLPRARLGSAARLTSQHAAFAAVTAAVPRRTPFSLSRSPSRPFPFLSEIMCGMPFHPSPSPSCHLAVGTTQRRSGSQTGSLCSLLLCHAADKTSMHISLKERKVLRDFHLLSFSFFLGFPLFVRPPPPFCISHSVPPSVQSVVYILRLQFAS